MSSRCSERASRSMCVPPASAASPPPHACLQNVPAQVVALTCDTTGTLIASHYVNPATKIACIFGTGCNAAYMERVGDIPKMAGLNIDPEAQIAINCEWVRSSRCCYTWTAC